MPLSRFSQLQTPDGVASIDPREVILVGPSTKTPNPGGQEVIQTRMVYLRGGHAIVMLDIRANLQVVFGDR